MLRFRLRSHPRKINVFPGAGTQERLDRLRQLVSALVRYERIEPSHAQADEARQYAERLIYLAVKNGDKHQRTMELADFWLLEKDLVHKLFKVLVPRFQNYRTSYTDLHIQAVEYPGTGHSNGVLELKGNPWPAVVPRQRDTKFVLSNVLLSAARHDYHQQKRQTQTTPPTSKSADQLNTQPSIENSDGSSVDPPQQTEDTKR